MGAVGWLAVNKKGIKMPNFDRHNGTSARRRAMETVRKQSARKADKTRTREEKRREEKRIRIEEGNSHSHSSDSVREKSGKSFVLAISHLFAKEKKQHQADHTSAYALFEQYIWPESLAKPTGEARIRKVLEMVDGMKPSVKNRMAWLTNRLKREW